MKINTPTQDQIEVLTKHLIEINKQLFELRKNEPNVDYMDIVKTILLFSSPFLTGYIFYLLTRNKEFRIKKGELSGKIEQSIYEYRTAWRYYTYYHIYNECYTRVLKLWGDAGFSNLECEFTQATYQLSKTKAAENMEIHKKELATARAALVNVLSQYKFYILNKKRKTRFSQLDHSILHKSPVHYSFNGFNEYPKIMDELKLTLDKYEADIDKKLDSITLQIRGFLDENID